MAHKVTAAITIDVTGQTEVEDLLGELVDQANGFGADNIDGLNVTAATLDVTVQFTTDHTDPRAMVDGLAGDARRSLIWPASKVRNVTVLDVEPVESVAIDSDAEQILAALRSATAAAEALLNRA